MKKTIRNIRRKIAGWILGDDTVLYVPKSLAKYRGETAWSHMPDDVIGKFFRRTHSMFIDTVKKKFEDQEGFDSFRTTMTTQSVLWFASEMEKFKATSGDYTVRGSLDGGKTMSVWALRIEKCPDDEVMNEHENPEITQLEDGRITSLRVSFGNSGFDKWRKANETRRKAKEDEK